MKKLGSIMLVFVLMFSLVGCGASSMKETPEQAVKSALDAVKGGDSEKSSTYLDYNKLIKKSNQNAKGGLILRKLEYKVISSSTSGNTATVETKITNIDMNKIMSEYIGQVLNMAFAKNKDTTDTTSKDKMGTMLEDLINRTDNKTVTKTVKIKLTKDKNDWKINLDDELKSALLGGLKSSSTTAITPSGVTSK